MIPEKILCLHEFVNKGRNNLGAYPYMSIETGYLTHNMLIFEEIL